MVKWHNFWNICYRCSKYFPAQTYIQYLVKKFICFFFFTRKSISTLFYINVSPCSLLNFWFFIYLLIIECRAFSWIDEMVSTTPLPHPLFLVATGVIHSLVPRISNNQAHLSFSFNNDKLLYWSKKLIN